MSVYTNSSYGECFKSGSSEVELDAGIGHVNNWGPSPMQKPGSEAEKQGREEAAKKDLISGKV